jgi:sporadic carbohydrate cluster protein (TIGR04323 family)
MNKVRGYIFSRPFMGERVPQHVQNLVIRDYCERNSLHFLLSATEYAMPDCHLILEQVLGELAEISGLVAYSLFQLPEERLRRQCIYEQILSQQKDMHFAVEGLRANTQKECERIETLWSIRLTLPHCAQMDVQK